MAIGSSIDPAALDPVGVTRLRVERQGNKPAPRSVTGAAFVTITATRPARPLRDLGDVGNRDRGGEHRALPRTLFGGRHRQEEDREPLTRDGLRR
jgi:hypothetical protein